MVSHEEFVKAFQNYVKTPLTESETKLMLQVLGSCSSVSVTER